MICNSVGPFCPANPHAIPDDFVRKIPVWLLREGESGFYTFAGPLHVQPLTCPESFLGCERL